MDRVICPGCNCECYAIELEEYDQCTSCIDQMEESEMAHHQKNKVGDGDDYHSPSQIGNW